MTNLLSDLASKANAANERYRPNSIWKDCLGVFERSINLCQDNQAIDVALGIESVLEDTVQTVQEELNRDPELLYGMGHDELLMVMREQIQDIQAAEPGSMDRSVASNLLTRCAIEYQARFGSMSD